MGNGLAMKDHIHQTDRHCTCAFTQKHTWYL